ncbi:hypothetical protein MHB42_08155 [Lysinibacillus sp. FSL K6-0232]|uniref:hypothetical protein n=1 Tax=unclassified Lysinibacillus TaxID=2636778 RepID=UPI0030F95DEF
MKKVGGVLIILIAGVLALGFVNKWYYPALPIDALTPKEALQKLKTSDQKLVAIGTDNDVTWYITKNPEKGMLEVDETIQQLLSRNGWALKEKEGSGLFFEKDGERLIVSKEMWTSRYVLIKVPSF